MIPFNQPYFTGKESEYIDYARDLGQLAGNGHFTKLCHETLKSKYGFPACFLSNSATNALEMVVLLCDFEAGDEIIIPSYTFVSTATPFANAGLNLRFADSEAKRPHISADHIKDLINEKTKAIVIMHYAGVACEIEKIKELADENGIILIEDAAHCINSYYKNKPLGSFGHFSVFSFHETKNISCGQGGLLVVNDLKYLKKAEQIWMKGTNRLEMEKGLVNHYEWTSKGSSFLPSEITAAFLFAQLENVNSIQNKRKAIWLRYYNSLDKLNLPIDLPVIKDVQQHNFHIFYFTVASNSIRAELLSHLKNHGILALFHYLPLHKSPYIRELNTNEIRLKNAEYFGSCLIRLPLFNSLKESQCDFIVNSIKDFFGNIEN